MQPPAAAPASLTLPAAAPVPALVARLSVPAAGVVFQHVAGTVSGANMNYGSLYSFAWYLGGASGRELRGPRVAFGRAGMRGREDVKQRKQ
ncbi:hypothetical protein ACFFLM_21330 [Deinococcus oregonensis]|uniref:Uncharacterized protein n=1 Tax=Deinococcus oregonensis TaxID=1805970 RepID=A0ABV6B444_9DEIO